MQDILLALLVQKDEDAAREVLSSEADMSSRINYYKAAGQLRSGNGYTARDMYIALGDYRDSAARALKCGLKWPKNGQIYRNSDYKKKTCTLKIKANRSKDFATYVKVYTQGDVLVCTAFIAGTGSASVSIPAGNYYINTGVGKDWFGTGEAFGEGGDAYYSRLTFDGSDDNTIKLKSGYSYTLTLQIQDAKQEANVGSRYQDWGNF